MGGGSRDNASSAASAPSLRFARSTPPIRDDRTRHPVGMDRLLEADLPPLAADEVGREVSSGCPWFADPMLALDEAKAIVLSKSVEMFEVAVCRSPLGQRRVGEDRMNVENSPLLNLPDTAPGRRRRSDSRIASGVGRPPISGRSPGSAAGGNGAAEPGRTGRSGDSSKPRRRAWRAGWTRHPGRQGASRGGLPRGR